MRAVLNHRDFDNLTLRAYRRAGKTVPAWLADKIAREEGIKP